MIKGININALNQPAMPIVSGSKANPISQLQAFSLQNTELSGGSSETAMLDLTDLIASLKLLLANQSAQDTPASKSAMDEFNNTEVLNSLTIDTGLLGPSTMADKSNELAATMTHQSSELAAPMAMLQVPPVNVPLLPDSLISHTKISLQKPNLVEPLNLEKRLTSLEKMKAATIDTKSHPLPLGMSQPMAEIPLASIMTAKTSEAVAATTNKGATGVGDNLINPVFPISELEHAKRALTKAEFSTLKEQFTQTKGSTNIGQGEGKVPKQQLTASKDTNLLVSRVTPFSSTTLISEGTGDPRAHSANEPNPSITNVTRSTELTPLSQAKERVFGGEEMKSIAQRIATISEHQARGEIKQLQVELAPKDLGKIDIKLVMNLDKLNISVNAANSNVRDWLNYGADRLRLFIEQEANVSVDVDIQGQAQQYKEKDNQHSSLSLSTQVDTQEHDADHAMTSTQTTAIAKA